MATAADARGVALDHGRRSAWLLAETFGISLVLAGCALLAASRDELWLAAALSVPRGLWIQRHYCVGHEAAHGKLFPAHRLANAIWGQLALLALLTPLAVFRKIHQFHHGHNRRDMYTSALEVIHIAKDTPLRRWGAWARWLLLTFACGWFWHGLVSVLMFLLLPVSVAERVSLAFRGWTRRERLQSIGAFALALALHIAAWAILGGRVGAVVCGGPLLVFSWIYSSQLYIYHYKRSVGPNVTEHARALGGPWISWWLLNLNQHDTHHRRPAVVWYALKHAATGTREPAGSWWGGIARQLRGPRIVVEPRPQ